MARHAGDAMSRRAATPSAREDAAAPMRGRAATPSAREYAAAPMRGRAALSLSLVLALAVALPSASPAAARSVAAAEAPAGRPFYAHSRNELHLVDPIARTTRFVMALPDRTTDLAISAGGILYACTELDLYRVNLEARRLDFAGSFGATTGMNALGFGPDGRLYGAGHDGGIYVVSTSTGEARRLGSLPSGIESAGDVVSGPNDTILITTHDPGVVHDSLYAFDPDTLAGHFVGKLSHDRVYGLAIRGATTFAFTEAGEVLVLDPRSGATRVLFVVPLAFWGVVDRLP